MKKVFIYAIIAILIITFSGCGEENMARIAEETNNTLVDTNVTDDTPYYEKSRITISSRIARSSFMIKDGFLYSTGYNNNGQLALNDTVDRDVFTNTGISNVKSVSNGEFHTIILKEDGSVYGVGSNYSGQLGMNLGSNFSTSSFIKLNISNVKKVACGSWHTIILKEDGSVWMAGDNFLGTLGLNDNTDRSIFTEIPIKNIIDVSAGFRTSFIITADGVVYSAGANAFGALGVGDAIERNSFTNTGINNVEKVSCGYYHTAIIKKDGSLFATGWNNYGQLGVNDNVDRHEFTNTGLSDVIEVSSGRDHTMIIKEDGSLFGTGSNIEGQIGIGGTTSTMVFLDTGENNILAVSSGLNHTTIINSSFSLFSTGWNTNGELGLSDNTKRTTFTNTGLDTDEFVYDSLTYYSQGDVVRVGNYRYTTTLLSEISPSPFVTLTEIGAINQLKPFDDTNITPAISSSPMTYTIKGTEEFNSFTLAKVLASSITYTFRNSLNAVLKTETIAIDCKRDPDGILSLYPTTVTYYAGQQMEANSTVEITLTHSDDIELGDFTLNNSIDSGFTNLTFSHGIKDHNDYTPDAWGQVSESVKAIVTKFDVTMDVKITNYDYMVSYLESIAGKNVTIDASDSNGEVANGSTIFASLTRRVRVVSPNIASKVKDNDIDPMATLKFKVEEIV